jgi:hypothetical protein
MKKFKVNQKVSIKIAKLSPWYREDDSVIEATVSLVSTRKSDPKDILYRLSLDKKMAKKYPLVLDYWYLADKGDSEFEELIADGVVEDSRMSNWIDADFLTVVGK